MRATPILSILALPALVACGPDPVVPTDGALVGIEIVSGDDQSAPAGTELAEPIRAQPLRMDGDPHPTAGVWFKIMSGEGRVRVGGSSAQGNGASVSVVAGGLAEARWTLGPATGQQTLRVFTVAIFDTFAVDVTATATAN